MGRILFSLLLAGVFALPVFGQSLQSRIESYKLANGLKVILLEDHDIPNVALYTFFRVGSRNERPGLTGVSHFIEHMMFNGTAKVGPGQFDRNMEFVGGANNAYTAQDMTAYSDWFPAAALEKMVEMEADRMQGAAFVPEVLESERGVVASERRMSTENNNAAILMENVNATSIMAHPYHWDVIGWMSDILSWKREQIQEYYKTYYAPNNAVLVLVGDFKKSTAKSLIEKYYTPIPSGKTPSAVTTVEPPQQGLKQVLVKKEAQAPLYMAVWHTPSVSQPGFYPLSLLDKILMKGESSRLYRRLVREERIALDVSGGIQETLDPYLFTVFVEAVPGADLGKIDRIVEEEMGKVVREGVTEKEVQKAINMVQNDFYRPLQTIAGLANALGQAELFYGDYRKLFSLMESYKAVTPDSIKAISSQTFTLNNKTLGNLVPEGGAQ